MLSFKHVMNKWTVLISMRLGFYLKCINDKEILSIDLILPLNELALFKWHRSPLHWKQKGQTQCCLNAIACINFVQCVSIQWYCYTNEMPKVMKSKDMSYEWFDGFFFLFFLLLEKTISRHFFLPYRFVFNVDGCGREMLV